MRPLSGGGMEIIMEQWMIRMKKADFAAIAARFGIDPVTARLIRNRDLTEDAEIEKYLFGGLDDLYDPMQMKGMEEAAEILLEKIREKKPVRVIGDYDIDGIMATYILLTGLSRLGADVDQRIPERLKDGYGLNESLVREAHSDGRDTILTCDNGISACEQIRLAKELGMTAIVTDHHEVPFDPETLEETLPPADAVIDPKQEGCAYPFKELCGAAIAWKLICVLYERAGIPAAECEALLEFAAIATVGDVVELRDENRIIVKEGLKRLHATRHPGLSALISLNNLDPAVLDTYHIGFIIGPALNASGRLDTAQKALSLLSAPDETAALSLASELINLNTSRKAMTEEYTEKAIELVETTEIGRDRILVVYLPDCHESLAGIIAGRLREKYNKPSFVLTDSEEAVKGSGRSIPEYSMYTHLVRCGDLLLKYGGHPMAAGLSLPAENVDAFRKTVNEQCSLSEKDLAPKIHIDLQMPLGYISQSLVRDFDRLRPFGKGNEKPLFVQKGLTVLNPQIVGKNRNVVRMQLKDPKGAILNGVYFGDAEAFRSYVSTHPVISAVYYPVINEFRGMSSLQITVTNYR